MPYRYLADLVVVADAGLMSATNLRDLDEAVFTVGSLATKATAVNLETHILGGASAILGAESGM